MLDMNVRYGDAAAPDWRKFKDDSVDDDEELGETPKSVIDMLGFDPLEVETAHAHDEDGPARMELTVHGLPIVIETKRGQYRHGVGWRQKMPYHYGFIQGVKGADGDSLDVALGPEPESGWAYVFDQRHVDRKHFDEHKVFLGYSSLGEALQAFNAGHHLACVVYMDCSPMQIEDFKQWLKTHDMSTPAGMVKA